GDREDRQLDSNETREHQRRFLFAQALIAAISSSRKRSSLPSLLRASAHQPPTSICDVGHGVSGNGAEAGAGGAAGAAATDAAIAVDADVCVSGAGVPGGVSGCDGAKAVLIGPLDGSHMSRT